MAVTYIPQENHLGNLTSLLLQLVMRKQDQEYQREQLKLARDRLKIEQGQADLATQQAQRAMAAQDASNTAATALLMSKAAGMNLPTLQALAAVPGALSWQPGQPQGFMPAMPAPQVNRQALSGQVASQLLPQVQASEQANAELRRTEAQTEQATVGTQIARAAEAREASAFPLHQKLVQAQIQAANDQSGQARAAVRNADREYRLAFQREVGDMLDGKRQTFESLLRTFSMVPGVSPAAVTAQASQIVYGSPTVPSERVLRTDAETFLGNASKAAQSDTEYRAFKDSQHRGTIAERIGLNPTLRQRVDAMLASGAEPQAVYDFAKASPDIQRLQKANEPNVLNQIAAYATAVGGKPVKLDASQESGRSVGEFFRRVRDIARKAQKYYKLDVPSNQANR